jgi:phosphopantothenoylcysteine decarboxylase/phosphopantothenate--cysteine ligase
MKRRRLLFSRIIVTGGPTREWLDPVRYISNASSGKMGLSLVKRAAGYSDDVVFIHGPLSVSYGISGFEDVPVESTVEMRDAVLSGLCPGALLVMAAAPADYMPVRKEERKIKKGQERITIELVKTPDILKAVREKKINENIPMTVVGFAAETNDAVAYGRGKLSDKGLDAICVNDLTRKGAGFGIDTNIITMLFPDGSARELPLMSKDDAAEEIFKAVIEHRSS